MLNTAIVLVTIISLLLGFKWLFKVFGAESPERLVERAEENLKQLKKDANNKTAFVAAWFISLGISLSLISLCIYILTQKINLV